MVFLNNYRTLLSLLYDQEIDVQRPHWVGRHDDVDLNIQRPEIARLMGINEPGSSEWESPFRIYDQWIVANDSMALDIMKQEDFTPDDPIILADNPDMLPDTNIIPDFPLANLSVYVAPRGKPEALVHKPQNQARFLRGTDNSR